jgi:hypothetical protein
VALSLKRVTTVEKCGLLSTKSWWTSRLSSLVNGLQREVVDGLHGSSLPRTSARRGAAPDSDRCVVLGVPHVCCVGEEAASFCVVDLGLMGTITEEEGKPPKLYLVV